jgi:hypothetical protein
MDTGANGDEPRFLATNLLEVQKVSPRPLLDIFAYSPNASIRNDCQTRSPIPLLEADQALEENAGRFHDSPGGRIARRPDAIQKRNDDGEMDCISALRVPMNSARAANSNRLSVRSHCHA